MQPGEGFCVLTLNGFSALGFVELFESAKKVLDNMPSFKVQFHFNGYIIVVNDNTVQSAWEKYQSQKFEKVS